MVYNTNTGLVIIPIHTWSLSHAIHVRSFHPMLILRQHVLEYIVHIWMRNHFLKNNNYDDHITTIYICVVIVLFIIAVIYDRIISSVSIEEAIPIYLSCVFRILCRYEIWNTTYSTVWLHNCTNTMCNLLYIHLYFIIQTDYVLVQLDNSVICKAWQI